LKAAQQSQGIQTLLEAEKEASKIVQQARQCKLMAYGNSALLDLNLFIDRIQKLKDARTEATKEIEAYKRAKEQEFRAFEDSVRSATLRR